MENIGFRLTMVLNPFLHRAAIVLPFDKNIVTSLPEA